MTTMELNEAVLESTERESTAGRSGGGIAAGASGGRSGRR